MPRRLLSACLLVVASFPDVRAQAGASPFLPPAAAAPAAAAPAGSLEYGGYLTTAQGRVFRVIDKSRKGGAGGVFLRLEERDPGLDVVVKAFDPRTDTLTVEQQGRTFTLEERKARIAPAAASVAPAAPVAGPLPVNVAPAVIQSVVPNPSPADEQRRLEAVAAEVARRRALREQGGQAPGAVPAQPGPGNRQQP